MPRLTTSRLSHHKLEVYENAWFFIAMAMSTLLFIAVVASFFSGTYSVVSESGGHHIQGVVNGRLDPSNLAGTPFANPGVHTRPDGSIEAFVVAKAFQFDPPVLKVPANKPITIHVTSADVLHGYYVEKTNINATVMPGQVSSFTTRFKRAGKLGVICNEYCGTGHHNMINRIIIE